MYLAIVDCATSIFQYQQLAVNPRGAPPRILAAHPSCEVADLTVNARSSNAQARPPVPIGAESAMVPADYALGLDDGAQVRKPFNLKEVCKEEPCYVAD